MVFIDDKKILIENANRKKRGLNGDFLILNFYEDIDYSYYYC